MEQAAHYADRVSSVPRNRVIYIVNATGVKLARDFDSPYLANKFVNKLKHSKHCTLVSYPPST